MCSRVENLNFIHNTSSPVDLMVLVVFQAKMRFVELVYVLATEEAERIGVDHVARVSAGDAREGSMGR